MLAGRRASLFDVPCTGEGTEGRNSAARVYLEVGQVARTQVSPLPSWHAHDVLQPLTNIILRNALSAAQLIWMQESPAMRQPMYTRSLHIQMHHNQEKLDKVMAEVQDLEKMLQAAGVWEKCWVPGLEEWCIMEEKGTM